MSDLQQQVNLVVAGRLEYWAGVICEQVNQRWSTRISPENDGEREIHHDNLATKGNIVSIDIIASGMAAFIAEYGSGHLIDVTSPYFAQYKSSEYWNGNREMDGNEFVGRAKGAIVHRIDGSTYASSGRAEGMRLEHDMGRGASFGKYPAYTAALPMHIIKEEVAATMPLMEMDINECVTQCCNDYVVKEMRNSLLV